MAAKCQAIPFKLPDLTCFEVINDEVWKRRQEHSSWPLPNEEMAGQDYLKEFSNSPVIVLAFNTRMLSAVRRLTILMQDSKPEPWGTMLQ